MRFFWRSRASTSRGDLYPPRFFLRAPFGVVALPVPLFNPRHNLSPSHEVKIRARNSIIPEIRGIIQRNFIRHEDRKVLFNVPGEGLNNCIDELVETYPTVLDLRIYGRNLLLANNPYS